MAIAKLNDAEDKIMRLDAELERERESPARAMKELLDGQAEMREGHRTHMLRIGSEAKDAQAQLDRLYDVLSRLGAGNGDKQSSFGKIRPFRLRPRLPALRDTGQPLPLLEPILDTGPGPLPTRRALDPASRFSTVSSRHLPRHDCRDPSISDSPTLELGQISTWLEEVSDATKAQWVAMEDLLDRMCQLECERAQEVEALGRGFGGDWRAAPFGT